MDRYDYYDYDPEYTPRSSWAESEVPSYTTDSDIPIMSTYADLPEHNKKPKKTVWEKIKAEYKDNRLGGDPIEMDDIANPNYHPKTESDWLRLAVVTPASDEDFPDKFVSIDDKYDRRYKIGKYAVGAAAVSAEAANEVPVAGPSDSGTPDIGISINNAAVVNPFASTTTVAGASSSPSSVAGPSRSNLSFAGPYGFQKKVAAASVSSTAVAGPSASTTTVADPSGRPSLADLASIPTKKSRGITQYKHRMGKTPKRPLVRKPARKGFNHFGYLNWPAKDLYWKRDESGAHLAFLIDQRDGFQAEWLRWYGMKKHWKGRMALDSAKETNSEVYADAYKAGEAGYDIELEYFRGGYEWHKGAVEYCLFHHNRLTRMCYEKDVEIAAGRGAKGGAGERYTADLFVGGGKGKGRAPESVVVEEAPVVVASSSRVEEVDHITEMFGGVEMGSAGEE